MSGGGDPTRQTPPPAGSAAPLAARAGRSTRGSGLGRTSRAARRHSQPGWAGSGRAVRIWPRIAAYLFDCALDAARRRRHRARRPSAASHERRLPAHVVAAWALVRVAGPALKGESPGKRMLRIATVDTTGRPIGHGVRAVRELPVWALYWIPFWWWRSMRCSPSGNWTAWDA